MSADQEKLSRDLNELLVNCPELRQLEKLLGNFNLFRVLRFELGEIRHSNVLAWLLQPEESHGLKDLFLRRWLMRVFHDSRYCNASRLSPVEFDSVSIRSVTVFREWNSIDLVIQAETFDQGIWVIAVENKVRAKQRIGQLSDYRKRVEAAFQHAQQKLFIFLTQSGEEKPEDSVFASATYTQVFEVLSGCVEEQGSSIGEEPKVLLKHYLRILKESFMENSEIAELAQRIYQKHRDALEVIFEHRMDSCQQLTLAVDRIVRNCARKTGVVPMIAGRGIVRFLPIEWQTPANLAGKAWSATDSAFILCEIILGRRFPKLEVVEGNSPKEWKRELWKIANDEKFPNTMNHTAESSWMRAYSVRSPYPVVHDEIEDFDAKAKEIWEWSKKQMATPEFKRVIKIIAAHLKKLP